MKSTRSAFQKKPSSSGKPRAARARGNLGGIQHPPDITPTPVVRRRVRFKATAASAGDQLTGTSFGDLWINTPTATTGFQLCNFFRIRSIEVWGPMASDLVPTTVSIEWNGATVGQFGKSVIHSDTSMGSAQPAHVRSAPPPDSQVAMWSASNSASNVVRLVYPINAIVDVVLDMVTVDNASATAVTGAVAGATVGAIYTRALNSPVNNNLVPVSLSTI